MSLRETVNSVDTNAKRQACMELINEDYNKLGQYKMGEVQSRNIMIIGRTRTGKSTIKLLLMDPRNVPDEMTLKSGTKDPQFQTFHIQQQEVVLNIIDTPGLFERSNVESDIRPDEAILKGIQLCANMEITKFHAICFCVALTSGINAQDVEAIEKLIAFLGDEIMNNSCLVITHCESKDEEQRNRLKLELEQDTFFKKINPFFKLGVYFSGSLNSDDYKHGNESLKNQYLTISDYRKKLLDLFIKIEKPFPISEMIISQIRQANDSVEQKTVQLEDEKQKNDELQSRIKELQEKYLKEKCLADDLRVKYEQQERLVTDSRVTHGQREGQLKNLQEKLQQKDNIIKRREKCQAQLGNDLKKIIEMEEHQTKKLEDNCAKLEHYNYELNQKFTSLNSQCYTHPVQSYPAERYSAQPYSVRSYSVQPTIQD
ncbi:unnamed protein product, partial [Rotaria socialis]